MSLPSSIAHYRITSKLGEGGMGAVYRATDTKLARDVAIKVLPDSFAQNPDRMARFTREAKVLALLNHPNIAAVYGVEDRAIVMELVEGANLKGPLPLETALDYAGQIADALEAAHDKGVTHRDLKPANIKVTPQGVVKVLDFGLAKAADRAPGDPINSPTVTMQSTEAGLIMGTAPYMAPEQARGHDVDKRADIWAFGVILWEMLTGRQMFTGATTSDILAAVLTKDPELEAVPARARPVIAACLEKDPRKRLRAAGDWRRLIAAPPAPAPSRSTGWLPWAITATAVAAVIVTAAILWPTPKTAPPLIHVVEDLASPLNVQNNLGLAVGISPDGSRIVYTQAQSGPRRLAIRRIDQPEIKEIPGTEGGGNAFFSPDSRRLGFVVSGGIYQVPVEGGVPTLIAKTAVDVRGAAWGRNGDIILGSRAGNPLFRVPSGGGEPAALTKLQKGETTHRWPALCAGDDYVLYESVPSTSIFAHNLRTGERTLVVRDGTFPHCLPAGELLFIRGGTLYSVGLDSRAHPQGEPRPVLENISSILNIGASQFGISDTGTVAYIPGWVDNDRPMLTWITPDGRQTQLGVVPRAAGPRLSPDARRVVLNIGEEGAWDLYVRDLERGAMTRLTPKAEAIGVQAVWTPDGKYVLYGVLGPDSGIYCVPSDGSAPARKIIAGRLRPRGFGRDGGTLLVASEDAVLTAPAEVGAGGVSLGQPATFVRVNNPTNYPVFSPDGRWIAYGSTEAQSPALSNEGQFSVSPFPGKGSKYPVAAGNLPVWSRGGELMVLAGGRIMSVACDAKGDLMQCGTLRQWTDQRLATRSRVPMFDAAPDGRVLALAAVGAVNPSAARVHLLFNFALPGQ